MSKILIIGGSFRNKGAEAMVLTCVRELRARYPQAEIVVASYVGTDDMPFGMQVVPESPGETFVLIPTGRDPARPLRVLAARILPASFGPFALRGDEYLRHFAGSSFVVDVSGFALSDQRSLLRQLVYAFEVLTADSLHVPFVALTRAFGPFRRRASRLLAQYCVQHMSMLFVRGPESAKHLAGLRARFPENVTRCSDIAYLFEPAEKRHADALLPPREATQPLVGIILNANVYLRRSPHGEANPYVRTLASVCDEVTECLQGHVVLLCHESHPDRDKDDREIAAMVRRVSANQARVHIIQPCHRAAVLKAVLRALDFVVASRFHGLVASISLSVPFLAAGGSHKYQELVDETGLEGVVLDGRHLEPEELVEHFRSAWERRQQLRSSLGTVTRQLKASAEVPFVGLRERWPPSNRAA